MQLSNLHSAHNGAPLSTKLVVPKDAQLLSIRSLEDQFVSRMCPLGSLHLASLHLTPLHLASRYLVSAQLCLAPLRFETILGVTGRTLLRKLKSHTTCGATKQARGRGMLLSRLVTLHLRSSLLHATLNLCGWMIGSRAGSKNGAE
jgi:hypothetical protein